VKSGAVENGIGYYERNGLLNWWMAI